MNLDNLTNKLEQMISDKFEFEQSSDSLDKLQSLAPQRLTVRKVLRFNRKNDSGRNAQTYKTILIVELGDKEFLRDTFTWTALVKESLGNPESSDLYLFVCWDEKIQPTIEECIRIEASEEICRKYVRRPEETNEVLLERTFVKDISNSSHGLAASDPLVNAFLKLSGSFEWFNDIELERWKTAFKSGKSGMDLVEFLFDLKEENNGAPQ